MALDKKSNFFSILFEKEGLEIYDPCFVVANKTIGDTDKYIGKKLHVEYLLNLPSMLPRWKDYEKLLEEEGREFQQWELEKYEDD